MTLGKAWKQGFEAGVGDGMEMGRAERVQEREVDWGLEMERRRVDLEGARRQGLAEGMVFGREKGRLEGVEEGVQIEREKWKLEGRKLGRQVGRQEGLELGLGLGFEEGMRLIGGEEERGRSQVTSDEHLRLVERLRKIVE